MKKFIPLMMVALVAPIGCQRNGNADSDPANATDTAEAVVAEEPTTAPVSEATESYFDRIASEPAPAPKRQVSAKPAAKAAQPTAKGEKIYVETEGAQGRVWGHVTMNGDRGTGTIHDWDENTWAVTVTRHGNELFAVDQNSRQYVFRLR